MRRSAATAWHAPSAILVFGVALGVRAVLLAFWPDLLAPSSDTSDRYALIARSLAAGEGFAIDGRPTAAAPPLYPLLLAALQLLGGAGDGLVRATLAVLDALQCALIFCIARRHFGGRAALWTGLVLAFCPYTIATIYFLSAEPLYMALHAGMLLLAGAAIAGGKGRKAAAAGVLLGLATLTRAVSLLLPAALAIPFRWSRERGSRLRPYAFLLAGMLVIVGPWIVRNAVVTGRFVPIQTLGGFHLYSDLAETRPRENNWSVSTDATFYGAAVDAIRDEPGRMLQLVQRRLRKMWYDTASGSTRTEDLLIRLNSVLLFFAAAGLWATRRWWRSLLYLYVTVAYYIIVHASMTVIFRYMLPIIPILVMFATVGAGALASGLRGAILRRVPAAAPAGPGEVAAPIRRRRSVQPISDPPAARSRAGTFRRRNAESR